MVSALDSGSKRVRVRALAGSFVSCSLGKTLYSRSASLHPGVQMGTGELSGKPDEIQEGTSIPSRGSSNTPSRFILIKPE